MRSVMSRTLPCTPTVTPFSWISRLLIYATPSATLVRDVGSWDPLAPLLAIGYKAGPALFNKPDSKLFKREYVDKTHEFFEKYGPRAIFLARFVPIRQG